MHKGMGLDVFNDMPMRRAVHALYECCYSVPLAADLARGRPYSNHDSLFRHADELLFALGESSIDSILQAYPDVAADRKVIHTELARITRARLERMLGPEGGYDNW
jgi:2-oxo-4-hydroxy-4-carboxy-5-ureidoimidazoline decarboxylase